MLELLHVPDGMSRSLGTWQQHLIYSTDEIIREIEKHLGFRNIGISICAFKEEETYLLFLPFDFDSRSLRKAWINAKKLYNHLVDLGLSCMINSTGRKGFHVLIETIPKTYSSKQIKKVQRHFKDTLELESVDEQIFGDKRRIIRIPWTFNVNGTWCRTIAWNDGKKLDLDDIVVRETSGDNYQQRNYEEKFIYNYPCIEWLVSEKSRDYWMKERGKFEPTEPVRITWACMRLWRGDSIDDIVEEGYNYNWDDGDKDKIRKKVEYLDGRNYSPYGCDSLKSLGYCIDNVYCQRRNGMKKNNIDEDLEELNII